MSRSWRGILEAEDEKNKLVLFFFYLLSSLLSLFLFASFSYSLLSFIISFCVSFLVRDGAQHTYTYIHAYTFIRTGSFNAHI